MRSENLLFWTAFNRLSVRRVYTSAGPCWIQFSEILAYFQCFGIESVAMREQFIMQIENLDHIWHQNYEESNG